MQKIQDYLSHHHHFAPGMCFLLFMKSSRCSPQAGVSRYLQPSRHLSRYCASNFCKPLSIVSHSSTSFQLFFGFPFFIPSTSHWTSFFIPSFRMPLPSQPLLCHKLFQSLYTRHFKNLLIVYFIFQRFPTYHSQHSHFCGLQLPFIFHFQCPTFSTTS